MDGCLITRFYESHRSHEPLIHIVAAVVSRSKIVEPKWYGKSITDTQHSSPFELDVLVNKTTTFNHRCIRCGAIMSLTIKNKLNDKYKPLKRRSNLFFYLLALIFSSFLSVSFFFYPYLKQNLDFNDMIFISQQYFAYILFAIFFLLVPLFYIIRFCFINGLDFLGLNEKYLFYADIEISSTYVPHKFKLLDYSEVKFVKRSRETGSYYY